MRTGGVYLILWPWARFLPHLVEAEKYSLLNMILTGLNLIMRKSLILNSDFLPGRNIHGTAEKTSVSFWIPHQTVGDGFLCSGGKLS